MNSDNRPIHLTSFLATGGNHAFQSEGKRFFVRLANLDFIPEGVEPEKIASFPYIKKTGGLVITLQPQGLSVYRNKKFPLKVTDHYLPLIVDDKSTVKRLYIITIQVRDIVSLTPEDFKRNVKVNAAYKHYEFGREKLERELQLELLRIVEEEVRAGIQRELEKFHGEKEAKPKKQTEVKQPEVTAKKKGFLVKKRL